MSQDPYDHARMMDLVVQEREANETLAEVRASLPKWKERCLLAEKHGEMVLAKEADAKVHELIAMGRQAKADLERIKQHKSMLRMETNLSTEDTTTRAELLIEDFRAMGIRPEDAELREVSRDVQAQDELAELKAQMKGNTKP